MIVITTFLLLFGAGAVLPMIEDDFSTWILFFTGIPMILAAFLTLLYGLSPGGIGLSVGLSKVLLVDLFLLVISAFVVSEKVSHTARVALSVLLLAGSIGSVAIFITDGRREILAARVELVTSYLDALKTGDFGAAYRTLCPDNRERESLEAFVERQMALPRILDYEIQGDEVQGQPRQESLRMQFGGGGYSGYYGATPDIEVDLRFTDGTSRKVAYALPDRAFRRACVGDESQVPAEDAAPE